MYFTPVARHPPCRSRRTIESQHKPRRWRMCGTAGTPVCPQQQCLWRTGGGSRARCLQTLAEVFHRNRICSAKQRAGRRGSHPRIRPEPAPVAAGISLRAETGDGHRSRIPHRLQGSVPGCTRKSAPQRKYLSARSGIQDSGRHSKNSENGGSLPDRRHRGGKRNGKPRDGRVSETPDFQKRNPGIRGERTGSLHLLRIQDSP